MTRRHLRPVRTPPELWFVFTTRNAESAGLVRDNKPLTARLDPSALRRLAAGAVPEADVAAQVRELGGAWVISPAGELAWRDTTPRDAGLDAAVAREERVWADQRPLRHFEDALARPGSARARV